MALGGWNIYVSERMYFRYLQKKTENSFEFWIRWCRIEKREYKQKVVCSSAICGLDIYIMEPHMGAYNEPIFKKKIFFFFENFLENIKKELICLFSWVFRFELFLNFATHYYCCWELWGFNLEEASIVFFLSKMSTNESSSQK